MGSIKLNLIFLCVWCVCSPGRPCCETGTAWLWLTRGTWLSSPTTRSKLGCRSSFTSPAGGTENTRELTSAQIIDCGFIRGRQLATLACEGDAGTEAGKQGQRGTGSQPQCFDCGPQSDVSVLGRLTGSPSLSQAVISQYEVKTKVCLTVWSWFRCLIATVMVPVHREGAKIHYSCSCSIFKISYCGAKGDSLHMHPASFDCCSWSEFKISVTAYSEPN